MPQIFQFIKRNFDGDNSFVFLQETHSIRVDEEQWQNEWESKIYFDHGNSNKCGVAILCPKDFDVNNTILFQSSESGRKLLLEIQCDDVTFALLNLYASTQSQKEEQNTFIASLQSDFEEHNGNLIIGGDLNIHLNSDLDKDTNATESTVPAKLRDMMEEFNYVDIWRTKKPNLKRYTWRRKHPIIQSRLDYWLIPQEMGYKVQNCKIHPAILTDHSLITLELKNPNVSRRSPGLWKFNQQLLLDAEYVNTVKEILMSDCNISNHVQKWEFLKMKIRELSISRGKQLRREQREEEIELLREQRLLKEIAEAEPTEINFQKLYVTEKKLELINAVKPKVSLFARKQNIVKKVPKI